MPNVTVTPPATIKVQVGPASAPTASAIQYGGQNSLKSATDLNMSIAADNDVIVYKQATNSFVVEPINFIVPLNFDNGFF